MKIYKIFETARFVAIALVLSVGISYVYAWTAPTQSPPAGNVAAPINTSATAQVKSGTLSATDLGINGNLVDTNTTIPFTPAGGTGAIAGNNWPNFSDVAANAVKLAGLTSADILAAASGGGGMQMFINEGDTSCPTGWSVARTGVITALDVGGGSYSVDYGGGVASALGYTCMGTGRTNGTASVSGSVSSNYVVIPMTPAGYSTANNMLSCAVCVR